MAKITRVFQKVFASTAGLNQIGKFGSLAAGTPETTTDPAQIQSLANFNSGWFSAIIGNNSPAIQDMNGLFHLAFRQLAYLLQQGIAEWDSQTEYHIGSRCAIGVDSYISLTDDNEGNNPSLDLVNWKRDGAQPGQMTDYVGATAPEGYILASGRTVGNGDSGATERANNDTFRLFTILWTDYSDADLPIQDSSGGASTRGSSALDDWNADKRMSLPDLRGRVGVGKDDMGGTAASRMTTAGAGIDGEGLGKSGGSQTHVLDATQMPSHTHTQNAHTHTQNAHAHNMLVNGGVAGGSYSAFDYLATGTSAGHSVFNASGPNTNTVMIVGSTATNQNSTAVNQNTGGGLAHTNTQPSFIVNKIIKL